MVIFTVQVKNAAYAVEIIRIHCPVFLGELNRFGDEAKRFNDPI
jgi:hypothetical protein